MTKRGVPLPGRFPAALRGPAVGLACVLAVGFFFRSQIGDGFTLLYGDRHDAVIALSIMEHWANVLRGLSPWNRTDYFFPVPGTLGYNDGYLLFGLLHAGFRAAGADPFLSGELVNAATRVIGFLGTYALARRLLGVGTGWAVLAATLFTISNNLYIRGSHAQLFSVGFVPVLGLLLHGTLAALLERRRAALLGWGTGFCLGFAACLLTGFYMAWYFAFLGGATMLAWLMVAGPPARRRLRQAILAEALPLLALGLLAVAVNLPFLALYLPKAAETGMHPWADVLRHVPSPLDVFHVGEANWLWGWLVRLANDQFRPGFPFWSERMTGLPPLLLLAFAASLLWLWRGGGALPPRQVALLRALGVAVVATWVLTLQIDGVTPWSLAYRFLPGAKAARVVARYQIFLTLPVVLLATAVLAAEARRLPWAGVALLCALLLAEQGNSYVPLFVDRPLEASRLAAVPPPPAGCRAFYVSAARTESRFGEEVANPYNHNTEAMLVAAVRHIPTINGISTFNPPFWPSAIPDDPEYREQIRAYAAHWGVTGLCALDLQRFLWDGPGDAEAR